MRTLAIVDFTQPIHESLKPVHQKICKGRSVGIALIEDGWKIDKLPVYFGSVFLSSPLQVWMHEKHEDQAAVHIYKLVVSKDSSEKLHYCTIIEVHSPQYLDANWLKALYVDQYNNHLERSPEIDALLKSLNILIDEIPST